MGTTITVRDEVTTRLGKPVFTFSLSLAAERVTVRDLIRARVEDEVAAYNARQGEHFQGLVQPSGAELTLNGYRLTKPRRISAERQVERALEAFEGNGFILLINDRQVEDLDSVVELTPGMTVTFLKLVPLVGG